MKLEKGWPKIWEDVARAGVLPGVDERRYREGYRLNRDAVERFLGAQRDPVLSAEQVAEVHHLQFAGLAPWAGQWARQAVVGEHRGSPGHRTALELRLLETQTRRLLAAVEPANLDHLTRVAAFYHARFEAIHPFPDGNGRVGRTLLAHFLQYTTAAAGLGGPAGMVKPNHLNKEVYVEALVVARDTHNLAPLARHFQFELIGRAESLGYLPSPFEIGPRSLPAEAFARELRGTVREPEAGIAAAALPARRPWLLDAKVEDLQRLVTRAVPGAKATASLGSVRKLLERARMETMSVGEAVALLGQLRAEKPFTVGGSLGLLRRDVGPEPFQRWARTVFDPLLRSLDDRSRSRLEVALDAQLTTADAAPAPSGSVTRTDETFALACSAAFIAPRPDPVLEATAEATRSLHGNAPAPDASSRPLGQTRTTGLQRPTRNRESGWER